MKLDANITFTEPVTSTLKTHNATVYVDADYVENNENDIYEYVINKLQAMFSRSFDRYDFTITNIDDLIYDLDNLHGLNNLLAENEQT